MPSSRIPTHPHKSATLLYARPLLLTCMPCTCILFVCLAILPRRALLRRAQCGPQEIASHSPARIGLACFTLYWCDRGGGGWGGGGDAGGGSGGSGSCGWYFYRCCRCSPTTSYDGCGDDLHLGLHILRLLVLVLLAACCCCCCCCSKSSPGGYKPGLDPPGLTLVH